MYVFFRFVSLVLVVTALMLMGADLISSLEHPGQFTVRSIADLWNLFQKGGAEAFLGWCGAHLPGFLAAAAAFTLKLWGWGVTGTLGVILAFVFGRRHDPA